MIDFNKYTTKLNNAMFVNINNFVHACSNQFMLHIQNKLVATCIIVDFYTRYHIHHVSDKQKTTNRTFKI